MDNLTHSLVGLTAAKAGLEKFSPGATTLCVLAANSPDIDVVVLIFKGRWEYLQHHRGLTHSIVGSAVLAVAVPLAFFLVDRLIARIKVREPRVRLKGLLLISIPVTATHPFLDWTNNYGTRFLLPWNPRWFYGDFTFVIDPFFWVILGGASFLLVSKRRSQIGIWLVIAAGCSLFILANALSARGIVASLPLAVIWITVLVVSVIFYRQDFGERFGSRIAMVGLALVTVYAAGLFFAHKVALRRAKVEAFAIANTHSEQVLRVAAMATAADPNRWVCVMETDKATYRFNLSLLRDLDDSPDFVRYAKPSGLAADRFAEAARDKRAQIFLGFARFPVMNVIGEDCMTQTFVQFADLRYTEPGTGRGTFSLDLPVNCWNVGRHSNERQ
jgi:inner membrane protein